MSLVASSRFPFGAVSDAAPRRNEARGIDQVCKESRQRESVTDSREQARLSALDRARPKIRLLVKEQETMTDSRMLAYEVVGRIFGRGESWVRRLLGGVAVAFSADQQEALHRAYVAYCRRVEDHAAALLAEAKQRWDVVDALDAGLGSAVDGPGGQRSEQGGDGLEPVRGALTRRDGRP